MKRYITQYPSRSTRHVVSVTQYQAHGLYQYAPRSLTNRLLGIMP